MSSGSLSATSRETGGGRAFWPGPRTALALVVLVAAVIVAVVVITLGGGGHPPARRQAAAGKYGHLPSWLPRISNGTPRLEVARPAAPVLHEEQGYAVTARLPQGTADVTAVGPQLPNWVASEDQSGKLPDGKLVPGTFMVTLVDADGTIPVSAGAFTILTDAGQIVHPKVTVEGGGRLPADLHAGQHIDLAVKAGVVEGSGSIRWAPLGRRVLVGWIYQVEFD